MRSSSLIVVCDNKVSVYGQDMYRTAAYDVDSLAARLEVDAFDIHEGLLVIGGEIDGPHPITEALIAEALPHIESVASVYEESEQKGIDGLVKSLLLQKEPVYCSFSLI